MEELSSMDSIHKAAVTDGGDDDDVADLADLGDVVDGADVHDSRLQQEAELAKKTVENCMDSSIVAENHTDGETTEAITNLTEDTKPSTDEVNTINENATENDTDDKIMDEISNDGNISQQQQHDDTDGNDEVTVDDFEHISEVTCEDMEDNLNSVAANKSPADDDTNHDSSNAIEEFDEVNNVAKEKVENEIPQNNDDNHSQVTTDESIVNLENTEVTEDEAVSHDSPSNELNEMLVTNETDRESRSFEEIDASSLSANNHSANEDESDMLGEADNTLPQPSAITESTDVVMNDIEDDSGPTDVEADCAMDETMNSNKEDDLKTSDISFSDIHMNEELNERIDEDENENEIENEQTVNKEVPDTVKEPDSNNSLQFSTNDLESKPTQDSSKTPIMEVDQQEEDNEPVENVQEPEDSDVCLIPDDTEKEVTEAEKEQAILAKENAEKEDEDKQQANITESVASNVRDQQTKNANANAEAAQSVTAQTEILKDENQHQESETKPAKTLLEQMPTTTATTATAATAVTAAAAAAADSSSILTTKISIGWIVNVRKICKQCNKEKNCGFRIKNSSDTTDVVEYLCQQKCCDALMSTHPGKYVIRKKKFLLDELTTATGDSLHTPDSLYRCLQCQQEKSCKYYFKQDDDSFYVCNDDCFNLLSADEPEKFKLKRHSIRVRNIGATTNLPSETNRKSGGGQQSRNFLTRTAEEAETARLERTSSFQRHCSECYEKISLGDKLLIWEIMDFCNEICLGKYQRTIGSKCQTCQGSVPHTSLGKYCVRFGFAIRQFCCAACLNEFKKGLKTCSCCQKDISGTNEGFLAPVGDKEQFKDFCSQTCMRRYDSMSNPKRKLRTDVCEVCNNDKPVRVEILLDDKEHTFCSNPCFSAFKFVSNIVADQCGMCFKYFERKSSENFTIYTEKRPKVFCSRICLNVYIVLNRHIVACQWCKVKKYNFDMISTQIDNQDVLMCSLNCLTLYGVSVKAFSRTTAICDNCTTTAPPQYHLTMSDASMRNFCTYQCVMQFQQQFSRIPLTLEMDNQTTSVVTAAASSQTHKLTGKNANSTTPFPTGLPKRVKLKVNQQTDNVTPMKLSGKAIASIKKGPITQTPTAMPIISTVSSLASGETETMIGNVTVRRNRAIRSRKIDSSPPPPPPTPAPASASVPTPSPAPAAAPTLASALPALANIGNNNSTNVVSQPRGRPRKNAISDRTQSPSPPNGSKRANNLGEKLNDKLPNNREGETKIVTVPPYPPTVRNVQTSCKPQTVECGMQSSPQLSTQSIQTENDYSNKILIPVPIPLYVPVPMRMYSLPFPVPVPIPLPIPVPIFIPTTRNSAKGIMKEIQKIQDKMPADPFEAELLMMAEMVAEEKNESNSDSEMEEDEIKADPSNDAIHYNNDTATIQALDDVAENHQHVYGEDVLQMAIKMATDEYDHQPTHNTVDLESAMTTNTISNPSELLHDDKNISHLNEHNLQQTHLLDQSRKRTSPLTQHNNRQMSVKRQRFDIMEHETQMIQQPMEVNEKPDANMCLKFTFGVNAWKQWVIMKNTEIDKNSVRRRPFKTELLQMTADELNYSLCLFVKEVRKPNGTEYAPDTIYYLVLGIQQYLYENGRIDNIFTDPYYENFTDCLDEVARKFSILYNDSQYIVTRVEEEHLWECKQLGAHSPHVLLCTLMFFNTKHFNLTTVDEHMQLSFSHIMKHWKRNPQNCKTPGTRNVLLRFYPPQSGIDANPRKKKVYEQQENEENPLRCPVRLYEFYLSKCPESVKTRNDVFYLQPERSCVPDSPVWYSTQPLSRESLQKMLHRVKMVKEINIALLTS